MATSQHSEKSKRKREPYRDPDEYRASMIALAEVFFTMLVDRASGETDLDEFGKAHCWLHIETVQRLMELQGTVMSILETAEVQTARSAAVEEARVRRSGMLLRFLFGVDRRMDRSRFAASC